MSEMERTVWQMKYFLERNLAEVAKENGIGALSVGEYTNCSPAIVSMVIERGWLPGYAVLLMHEGKHIRVVLDKQIMSDFDAIALFGRAYSELTDRQRLQVNVGLIVNTSVEDARGSVQRADLLVLYLAREAAQGRKTLTSVINAEIKRRGKAGTK